MEPSLQLLSYSFVIFLMMFFLVKPCTAFTTLYKLNRENLSTNAYHFFFLLYALYIIFAFNSSDFYSYWNSFIYSKLFLSHDILGYEQIYIYLADFFDNYIVWRCVIWGSAILLFFFTSKKLNIDYRFSMLSIILFGFGLNVYTRGILGHTMLLMGVVLFVDDNSSISKKVLGLILFCLSFIFHKSIFINILFALIAFYPINKKSFILSIFLFPILTTIATILIENIVSGAFSLSFINNTNNVGDVAESYAASENMELTFWGRIGNFIRYFPEYITIFYLANRVLYKKVFNGIKQERLYKYLFRLSYVSIYIASLFAFVETSTWIYLRFKHMAFFPLIFVLAKVFSLEEKSNIWTKSIIFFQFLALFYQWFANFYNFE